MVVFRNALFKRNTDLFRQSEIDRISEYIELEQPNGQSVFVQRVGVVMFCEPGTDLQMEVVSSK